MYTTSHYIQIPERDAAPIFTSSGYTGRSYIRPVRKIAHPAGGRMGHKWPEYHYRPHTSLLYLSILTKTLVIASANIGQQW